MALYNPLHCVCNNTNTVTISTSLLQHGIHDEDSARDFSKFIERLEALLEIYNMKSSNVDKTVVVMESFPASLFVSLLEWLHSLDMKGNNRYDSYFLIWECNIGDLAGLSPTAFYRSSILHLNEPRYFTLSEYTIRIAQRLFDQSDVLINSILCVLKPILNSFVDKYVQLQNMNDYGYTKMCLTQSVLKLVRDMYYNCGGDHRQHFNEQYAGRDEVITWRSPASVKRIILFSCIWAIGTLPSWGGRKNFTLWFDSHFKTMQRSEPSNFPPLHDPFAYILRFDPDDVNELCWAYCFGSYVVKYSADGSEDGTRIRKNMEDANDNQFDSPSGTSGNNVPEFIRWRFPRENRLPRVLCDRSFRCNSNFRSTIEIMPTKESVALQLIQRIFLHNGGVMFISGESGSGKSALQQLLLMDKTLERRWVCAVGGSNASRLPKYIDIVRKENAKTIMEGEHFEAGAIFIDDVSMPTQLDSFRYIIEHSNYVDDNQLVHPLQFTYGVISAREGEIDAKSLGRVMRYSLNVHLEKEAMLSVFTSMVAQSCVTMQPENALEVVAASMQIFKEISLLHPMLEPEQDHDAIEQGKRIYSLV